MGKVVVHGGGRIFYLLTGVSFVWNLEARLRRYRAVAAFDHGAEEN